MITRLTNLRRHQKGFTIIELMIATTVLSTILVLVTIVMVNIGTLYYRGINQARVQDAVRTISDDIIKNVQLSDKSPIGPISVPGVANTYAYCVGPVRYTYVLGAAIGNKAPGTSITYYQVLWRDTNPSPGSCPTQIDPTNPASAEVDLTKSNLANLDAANQGKELVTSNSRLTQFSMATGTSLTTVTVGIAYGDNDLLCNPSLIAASCNTATAMPSWVDYRGSNVLCKNGKGDQFCSTASLTSSAIKRVASGSF